MADIREITIDWKSAGSPGGTSVLHFLGSGSAADQRAALGASLELIELVLAVSTQWAIAEEGREFDSATGTLTGVWADSLPTSGSGTVSGDPVPNASQALLRLTTNTITDGRLLKGRVFIPGLSQFAINAGEPSGDVLSAFGSAFAGLVALDEWGVWQRPRAAKPEAEPPVAARAGAFATIISTSAWNEMAVLRRRR